MAVPEAAPRTLCVPGVGPSTQMADTLPEASLVTVADVEPFTAPPPAVTVTVKLLPLAGVVVPSLFLAEIVNATGMDAPTCADDGGALVTTTV